MTAQRNAHAEGQAYTNHVQALQPKRYHTLIR